MTARPAHMPAEVRRKWPGITYPGSGYCQARHGRKNKCFSYSKHGGVLKAHRAAEQWLATVVPPGATKVTAADAQQDTSGNGVLIHVDRRHGIEQYSFRVAYRTAGGEERVRSFFIGSENTWTKARERAGFAAAKKFRLAYEDWRLNGGTHPMDTRDHLWAAAEH